MNLLKKMFRKNKVTEILLTTNAELYGRSLRELKKNSIHYETKTTNMGSQNRQIGSRWGQMGENIDMQIMYYIYVNKEDAHKARDLISGLRRNLSS